MWGGAPRHQTLLLWSLFCVACWEIAVLCAVSFPCLALRDFPANVPLLFYSTTSWNSHPPPVIPLAPPHHHSPSDATLREHSDVFLLH